MCANCLCILLFNLVWLSFRNSYCDVSCGDCGPESATTRTQTKTEQKSARQHMYKKGGPPKHIGCFEWGIHIHAAVIIKQILFQQSYDTNIVTHAAVALQILL